MELQESQILGSLNCDQISVEGGGGKTLAQTLAYITLLKGVVTKHFLAIKIIV